MFKPINCERFSAPDSDFSPGPAPILEWIKIDHLVVDTDYQREIGRRGAINVNQIAEHFDWSKFAPVVIAPVEGGLFAIVDGQHRTTAAMLRKIERVPCQIVQADRAQQAAAYAAVNGNITKTTAQQLYHAKLAANDPDALEISKICSSADVEVIRRNIPQSKLKVGQTQAIVSITRCAKLYGRDTLITALQCITQTADGNAGFVKATIIEALCQALHDVPAWRDAGDTLLRVMDKFRFPDAWDQIAAGRDKMFPGTTCKMMADKIRKFLSRRLPVATPKAAA
jgi:ParB-like nuclease domain